jgi:hypothetical protein
MKFPDNILIKYVYLQKDMKKFDIHEFTFEVQISYKTNFKVLLKLLLILYDT